MKNADGPRVLVVKACHGWAPVYTTIFTALALLASVERADAQGSRPFVRDDGVTVGIHAVHMVTRDASASPLRFAGTGASGSFDYQRTGTRYALRATLNAGALTMASRSISVERTLLGRTDVSLLRSLRLSAPLSLDVGLSLSGNVTVTRQNFAALDVAPTLFRFAAISLGPAIGLTRQSQVGTARLYLSMPVTSVVDHPFSAVKSAYAGFVPRFASLRDYRALSAGALYTTGNHGRVGATAGAGVSTMRYAHGQLMHTVASSVSVAVVVRSRTVRS